MKPQIVAASLAGLLFGFASSAQLFPITHHAEALTPTISKVAYHVRPVAQPIKQTDCSLVACMALTFDDGPDPTTTPRVLDELEAAGVHATFFVIGSRVGGNESLLRRMHMAGHDIGNHTWSHPNLTMLDPASIYAQYANTQSAIAAAGVPVPKLFRPPYGAYNATVRANVPLPFMLWNNDPEDWRTPDPAKIIASVLAQAGSGRVVVMHDVDVATADALPGIIEKLQAQGYELVTVSQLFNLAPTAQGEYYGR